METHAPDSHTDIPYGHAPQTTTYIGLSGAEYALELQKYAEETARRIASQPIIRQGWSLPLRSAPEALCVLAACLVASSSDCAQHATVDPYVHAPLTMDRGVNADESRLAVLPFENVHANLQHCANLGREAFHDAQRRMGALKDVAAHMIARTGPIRRIIELLNDPEEARFALRPELDFLKGRTNTCQQEAAAMQEAFDRWLRFVMALQKALVNQQGLERRHQQKMSKDEIEAQKRMDDLQEEIRQADRHIEAAQIGLAKSERERDTAETAYHQILARPPLTPPSIDDIRRKLVNPNQDDWPGIWPKIQKFFLGRSDAEDRKLDDEASRLFQLLKHEQEKYQQRHQDAMQVRDRSANTVKHMRDAVEAAEKRKCDAEERRFKASTAMEDAKKNLELLGRGEASLQQIKQIIDTSCRKLQILKSHVDSLKEFFGNLSGFVKNTAEQHVADFLRVIEAGIRAGGQQADASIIRNMRLRECSKKKLLETVLDVQAHFSSMSDIAAVYVDISREIIRPSINRMEALPHHTGSEFEQKRLEFQQWTEESSRKIETMAREANPGIRRRMIESAKTAIPPA